MSSDKRAANAVGGRTARPCDSCLCKRARWYCAADDAFLCQSCDASVHSANPLARRHERLCLKTTSGDSTLSSDPFPSWLNGFRRKARTPRHSKTTTAKVEPLQIPLLVPDLSSSDEPSPRDEDQLLYRVPIFDPIADAIIPAVDSIPASGESKPFTLHEDDVVAEADYMMEFATCDADLAADVESLLGKGFEEEESFSMEALGLIEGEMEWRIKVEEVDVAGLDARHVDASELDLSCETLDLKFGYESPTTTMMYEEEKEKEKEKKKICLRLDYEAVITEWASKGSPWTTGDRPQLNLDDCWPDWTGMWGWEHQHQQQQQYEYGVGVGVGGGQGEGDRGREARVSRYREKRRSRLFSKKIRYEVRKLNAEKRPRMKGRFVKRASLAGGGPVAIAAVAFPF